MFETGSRTRQVATFMLPADVAAFSRAVAGPIAGFAAWQTHRHTEKPVVHESLAAAMEHDGSQAFLRLLDPGGATAGPIIQYLQGTVAATDTTALGSPALRLYRPGPGQPEHIEPGRLAFKWFPENEPEWVRRDFALLAGAAWAALLKVTAPHVTRADGRPVRRFRIGPAAKAWVLADPGRVIRADALPLRVRP